MIRLLLATILLSFITFSYANENTTLRFEQLFGPDKAKDFSAGLDYDLNDQSSIYADFLQSQDSGTSRTITFGADHDLNDIQSFNGDVTYSKDQDDLQGLGFDLGTDYYIFETTDLAINLGLTNYSKEEKESTTTDKTKYYQFKLGGEIEQEFFEFFSVSAGLKKYLYSDNSETITQINRNRTNSTPFSATSSSIDQKISMGLRFFKENYPSLSYRFSSSQYKDSTKTKEHDLTLSYRLKSWKVAFVYQNIRPENNPVEHWWGPRISYKF